MKVGDKVYFGRGPVEFIGFVEAVNPNEAQVYGVETGCLAAKCQSVKISTQVEGSHQFYVLSDEAFSELSKNEPAFN